MAITITTQPGANTINAAYTPILFRVDANQLPNANAACPIVIADIYVNDLYYSSISSTDYDLLVVFSFVFRYYDFDIQDKIQECLNSNFARMYEGTEGDIEFTPWEDYSVKVQVKFREGYIDSDGFTQFYGTAPVKGTKYVAPIAGTGTATSNVFYVINATLNRQDNYDLAAHVAAYNDTYQQGSQLSHRPNYIEYENKRIGAGKYYISSQDRDFIFWFSHQYTNSPSWLINVYATMNDGTVLIGGAKTYNSPAGTAPYKIYSFDAGVPNMRKMYSAINWSKVVKYEVFIYHAFFQAARQLYYINNICEDEKVRIFFLNSLGTYDAINFVNKQEVAKTNTSTIWKKTLPTAPNFVQPVDINSKSHHSLNRGQVIRTEMYEAICRDYKEEDMEWIKELIGSPRAYIQWSGKEGVPAGLLPILIEDIEVLTLKDVDRYEYEIRIKYIMSNEFKSIR